MLVYYFLRSEGVQKYENISTLPSIRRYEFKYTTKFLQFGFVGTIL